MRPRQQHQHCEIDFRSVNFAITFKRRCKADEPAVCAKAFGWSRSAGLADYRQWKRIKFGGASCSETNCARHARENNRAVFRRNVNARTLDRAKISSVTDSRFVQMSTVNKRRIGS